MATSSVIILGGVGSGVMVAEAIRDASSAGLEMNVLGFLNDAEPAGSEIEGIPVLGPFEGWRDCDEGARFITAIHKPKEMSVRSKCLLDLGIPAKRFVTICHPTAVIAANAVIGAGTYIGPHASIMPGARIGAHCSLRAGCYVSHDVIVGDFGFVGPNATVSGRARIGEGAHVGPNAAIREEIVIGPYALAGIGAVVHRDVSAHTIVAGNPARRIGSMPT